MRYRLSSLVAALLLVLGHPAFGGAIEQPVLVFGATGQLGSEVVRALLAAGHPVTAFVRPESDRARLQDLQVSYVIGDLLSAGDVAGAVASQKFYALVDASARGAASDDFYPRAMRNIVDAAKSHGHPKIILHGSVGAGDNIRRFPQAPFGRMAATLRAKGEAEAILSSSGLEWVIIRNGILMPAGTAPTRKARLSEDQGLMRSITRADLALLTANCLAEPAACFGQTWHAVDESLPFPDRYR
jgi:uncharacterized protein YbjT (DUF2867 family)